MVPISFLSTDWLGSIKKMLILDALIISLTWFSPLPKAKLLLANLCASSANIQSNVFLGAS